MTPKFCVEGRTRPKPQQEDCNITEPHPKGWFQQIMLEPDQRSCWWRWNMTYFFLLEPYMKCIQIISDIHYCSGFTLKHQTPDGKPSMHSPIYNLAIQSRPKHIYPSKTQRQLTDVAVAKLQHFPWKKSRVLSLPLTFKLPSGSFPSLVNCCTIDWCGFQDAKKNTCLGKQ